MFQKFSLCENDWIIFLIGIKGYYVWFDLATLMFYIISIVQGLILAAKISEPAKRYVPTIWVIARKWVEMMSEEKTIKTLLLPKSRGVIFELWQENIWS